MTAQTVELPSDLIDDIRNAFPQEKFVQQMLDERDYETVERCLRDAAYSPSIRAKMVAKAFESGNTAELLEEANRLAKMPELYKRFLQVTDKSLT